MDDLSAILTEARELGLNFFDVGEDLGLGGRQAAGPAGRAPVISNKCLTLPRADLLPGGGATLTGQTISAMLEATLQRLGATQLDLFQLEFPSQHLPDEAAVAVLRDAVESGRARAVGVCNCGAEQLQRAHDLLERMGVPLASNQVEYSLVRRDVETDGTLDMCAQLGVTLIARAPLSHGLLTTAALDRTDAEATKLRPLLLLLKFVGALGGGKTVEQVALNYLISKGVVVLPRVRTIADLRCQVGAVGWALDETESEVIKEKLTFMGF